MSTTFLALWLLRNKRIALLHARLKAEEDAKKVRAAEPTAPPPPGS
jgi:hypothetical protein